MLYIKIGNEKYPAKFQTFRTQANNEGIRVISNTAPTAKNGFVIVNDDSDVVFDRKDYKYLYRTDDKCKEYTAVSEDIIPVEGFTLGTPTDPYTVLSRQISAVSNRVNDIMPYKESKEAGIQDKECIFDGNYKNGVITATVITSSGDQKPCEIERSGDNITVRFEELKETATITISIQ